MTELSNTGHHRAGIASRRTEDDGAKVKRRALTAIAAIIVLAVLVVWLTNRQSTVEVTIGAGSSAIAEINRQNPPLSEKAERKNYLAGIRMAQACNIPVYKTRGIQYPQALRDRITYTEARAAAGTTDRFQISVPVYQGDVLSTRGGEHCVEATNTHPFDQR